MLCIMLLLQLLLWTPVTLFSWNGKKLSVSWENLEMMVLATNMYLQGRKINHGFKVITHSTSLCDDRAFCLPFHVLLNSKVSVMGDTCLCVPHCTGRSCAQVIYHKWTMRLEITALTRLPESLTSWNKKRLPEEQLKKVTSPKVHTVSQGTFFS